MLAMAVMLFLLAMLIFLFLGRLVEVLKSRQGKPTSHDELKS